VKVRKALQDIWTLSLQVQIENVRWPSGSLSLIQKGVDVTRTGERQLTIQLSSSGGEGAKVPNSALTGRSFRNRRTQKIAPMRLNRAEMAALLAKKKDR
jgi:hypothetical protein